MINTPHLYREELSAHLDVLVIHDSNWGRPELVTSSDGPARWPGSARWLFDRGAIPGEPFAFLDGDCDTAVAAMVEIHTPGKPAWYEVRKDGGVLLSKADFPEIAASIAEKRSEIDNLKAVR